MELLQTAIYIGVSMSVIIHTQQEMEDLGVKLVKNTDKFLLYGELGSGKTTLVKGLAA